MPKLVKNSIRHIFVAERYFTDLDPSDLDAGECFTKPIFSQNSKDTAFFWSYGGETVFFFMQ